MGARIPRQLHHTHHHLPEDDLEQSLRATGRRLSLPLMRRRGVRPAVIPFPSAESPPPPAEGFSEKAVPETEEEDLLSYPELLQLSLPMVSVELGWAVGEALILPFLVSVGVRPLIAGMVWLLNPVISLYLGPVVSRACFLWTEISVFGFCLIAWWILDCDVLRPSRPPETVPSLNERGRNPRCPPSHLRSGDH